MHVPRPHSPPYTVSGMMQKFNIKLHLPLECILYKGLTLYKVLNMIVASARDQ